MSTVKPLDYMSKPVMWTGLIGSIVLVGATMWWWYSIGPEMRALMTAFQALTLILIIVILLGILLTLGYSRMWANADGITVRNTLRVKTFAPHEVLGVRLRQGDPWAYLLLPNDKDPEEPKRYPILAIQSLEGKTATEKVLRLRQWLDVQLHDASEDHEPGASDDQGASAS